MKRRLALALAGMLASGTALSAPVAERIRGTVEAVEPGALTVRTIDGASVSLALTEATKVMGVAKSSLDAITPGSFVGTATKGEDPPRALEVHIFPEAMRGTGEGHRDWDTTPTRWPARAG